MYQIVINDKYYVSDVDIGARFIDDRCNVLGFETIDNRYGTKLFENKNIVQSIAEQIGGRVIEYVEKENIQVDFNINKQDVEDMVRFGVVKIK